MVSKDEMGPNLNENGEIIDFLEGTILQNSPEEHVRQRYLKILHFDYKYPKNVMKREVPIFHGRHELKDLSGNPIRADIVVYEDQTACINRDQGRIRFVVECKAPTETDGYNQLVSYIFNTSANGGVWFNGSGEDDQAQYFRRITEPEQKLIIWPNIPRYKESWDSVGRRKKSELLIPRDIKGILRRCHNRLHKQGSEEDDLTMDMVRIILAKTRDEEREGEWPNFYCTPEEYRTPEGREEVAKRVYELFNEVKNNNPIVFDEHEKINVGPNQIADVVVELKDYRLLADENNESQWDLMGTAYEEYTATYLKKKRGQFFTNRLIVNLLVEMTDPNTDEVILDPAGGSGGFVTAAMRHVNKYIENSKRDETAKRRAKATLRTNLFMVEISKRLVKVAKTAMILNGDGHAGFTQGDSLGEFDKLDPIILSKARRGMPKVILTNPPWAGVGEGRITTEDKLERFQLGKVWIWEKDQYKPTSELLKEGIPPELLFLERCIDWIAPGGRLGIVLPKGVLDTDTALPARHFLFQNSKLLAVINCHKNTFQPFTGPRPCLIILEKRSQQVSIDEIEDYPIFMAISRKIGQDSEGVPIYKTDDRGVKTSDLDHDLDEILQNFVDFKNGSLRESENIYSINFSDLDKEYLRINPQAFLPSLNETIKKILEMDGVDGWSVEELLHICPQVEIFKPPRLKSENLVVEDPKDKRNLEPYYTPSTLLQNKSESIKWFDLSKANSTQLRTIKILRLKPDEILISRSGSIGRVIYATEKFKNMIGSDDLIRVRIPDEKLRYYVYQYLRSKAGQDQIKRNEYGSIQQHLEAPHIQRILIPIPENLGKIKDIIDKTKKAIFLQQVADKIDIDAQKDISSLLASYDINED